MSLDDAHREYILARAALIDVLALGPTPEQHAAAVRRAGLSLDALVRAWRAEITEMRQAIDRTSSGVWRAFHEGDQELHGRIDDLARRLEDLIIRLDEPDPPPPPGAFDAPGD